MEMEIRKTFLESMVRHVSILIENGKFDGTEIKTANALRLLKKEIKNLKKKIKNETTK